MRECKYGLLNSYLQSMLHSPIYKQHPYCLCYTVLPSPTDALSFPGRILILTLTMLRYFFFPFFPFPVQHKHYLLSRLSSVQHHPVIFSLKWLKFSFTVIYKIKSSSTIPASKFLMLFLQTFFINMKGLQSFMYWLEHYNFPCLFCLLINSLDYIF